MVKFKETADVILSIVGIGLFIPITIWAIIDGFFEGGWVGLSIITLMIITFIVNMDDEEEE